MLSRVGYFFSFLLCLCCCFLGAYAFADATVVDPSDFLTQVLSVIQKFGGLSWMMKVSAVTLLLISSMKVSFLKTLIWDKLGEAQAWIAPILGLIAGIMGLGAGGIAVTGASIFAYVMSAGGAVIFHELLDSVKAIPGLGAVYVSMISFVESLLGGGTPPPAAKV